MILWVDDWICKQRLRLRVIRNGFESLLGHWTLCPFIIEESIKTWIGREVNDSFNASAALINLINVRGLFKCSLAYLPHFSPLSFTLASSFRLITRSLKRVLVIQELGSFRPVEIELVHWEMCRIQRNVNWENWFFISVFLSVCLWLSFFPLDIEFNNYLCECDANRDSNWIMDVSSWVDW